MLRTFTLWLVGVLSVLLALELLCRVLPVSTSTDTGYYTDPVILTYPPRHQWVAATGWDLRNAQHLTANNLGYAAHRDFVRDARAVALIGDSFVEASMLPAPDRPGKQLEHWLGSRPVYAMGSPGTSLLDYAERIRYAHEKLGVRDFVILMERGDVAQSLCGSGHVNGPCLDPITLAPLMKTLLPAGMVKRLLRHSALAQYLVSQLRVTPAGLGALFKPASPPQPVAAKASVITTSEELRIVDRVTQVFFARIKPHVQGRLIIVLDSDRSVLYSGKSISDEGRERFMQLANEAGATVIDTQPIFAAHVANSALKLEVGPYDQHLNPLAIGLISQAASKALGGL
ncbi:hypothetical protein [Rhodoferax sp. BLA1]|uniref:hypothetical protein n=1 Tax=Rhodoferax sp. BLA1 TaxID=2576062 RepID=UPI0015D3004F|nr:hypothetical protein [Rhodoferax sp. BLA1]